MIEKPLYSFSVNINEKDFMFLCSPNSSLEEAEKALDEMMMLIIKKKRIAGEMQAQRAAEAKEEV